MLSTSHARVFGLFMAACATACGGEAETTTASSASHSVVASFLLADHTIEFVENPDGTVGVVESMPLHSETELLVDPERSSSALEEFLYLAPETAPIPRALIAAALAEGPGEVTPGLPALVGQVQATRATVEGLTASINLEAPGVLGSAPTETKSQRQALNVPAGGSCGSNAANFFRGRYCNGTAPVERCGASYNGGNSYWYHNTNNSGSHRYKNTHSVIANCGTGNVRLKYEYRFLTLFHGWRWDDSLNRTIPSRRVVSHVDYGAVSRRRRMDAKRVSGSGGFRIVGHYGNNLVFLD